MIYSYKIGNKENEAVQNLRFFISSTLTFFDWIDIKVL